MQITRRMLSVLAALMLLVGTAQLFASQEQPQQPQQPQQRPTMQTVQGELGNVDVDKKTLTVKTSAGADMVFSYTEDTEVIGAQQGVAGLATKAGSPVVVHYTSSGDSKIAKKIEVKTAER